MLRRWMICSVPLLAVVACGREPAPEPGPVYDPAQTAAGGGKSDSAARAPRCDYCFPPDDLFPSDGGQASDAGQPPAPTACTAENDGCRLDGECCDGLFCDNQGYAFHVCLKPRADGDFCTADKQCQTGQCNQDYTCGPAATCAELAAACTADEQCCSGYCETYSVYLPSWHTCVEPKADGAYCNKDSECQSHRCQDYTCAAADAEPACGGRGCSSAADCCAGTYCDNTTYSPWVCTPLLADGDYCIDGTQCRSGTCIDYVCTR